MPEDGGNENAEIMVTNQETVKDPSIGRAKTFREVFVAPNWEHPVFFGISQSIPQLVSLVDWPDLGFFNQLARERCLDLPDGRPLSFVHQAKKPSRWRRRKESKLRYEESVLEQAVIPSRLASWHDFFNNISWLIFPRAKLALVERLAAANSNRTAYDVERAQFRSREGDRLAMLDEGGLIKIGQAPTRFVVFGHALQESFVAGKLDVWSLTLPLPFNIAGNSKDLLCKADSDLANLIQSGFFAVDAPGFESTCLKSLDLVTSISLTGSTIV